MCPAPLPDFLSVNGTPDPRLPPAPGPEAQLPQSPHIPGTPDTLEHIPQDLGEPENKGTLDPVQFMGFLDLPEPEDQGEGEPIHPQMQEITERNIQRRQALRNYPEPENELDDLSQAIGTLANANIQVPLPGGLIAAPHLEEDDDYRQLDPALKTFFRVLEKSGRVAKAAEIAGVARTSMYTLKKKNEVIARLWDRALSYRAELLEDEAIRRAVSGVREPVYYMGAVCGHKNVYSDSLLTTLLKGNMPEKYRENYKVELEGKMAVATLVLPSTTSAEEWAAQNAGTIIDQEPVDEYAL